MTNITVEGGGCGCTVVPMTTAFLAASLLDSPQDVDPFGHDLPVRTFSVTIEEGTMEWDDMMTDVFSAYTEDPYEYLGCECEIDWNCGRCGGTSRPTWIETRYDGRDEDPPMPYWAEVREAMGVEW